MSRIRTTKITLVIFVSSVAAILSWIMLTDFNALVSHMWSPLFAASEDRLSPSPTSPPPSTVTATAAATPSTSSHLPTVSKGADGWKQRDYNGVFFGESCVFERFVKKMRAGQRPNVVALGSSLTDGIGILPHETRKQYRFATLLPPLLQKATGMQVNVSLSVGGGCGSACWIHDLHRAVMYHPDLDLVIAEMNMDPATGKGDKSDFRQYDESFRRLILDFFFLRIPVMFWTGILERASRPGCPTCLPRGYHPITNNQHSVLRAAGVPFYSYRDSVWPDERNPPGNLFTKYWKPEGHIHPDRSTHHLIALGLSIAILKILKRFDKLQPACDNDALFQQPRLGYNFSEIGCPVPLTDLHGRGLSAGSFKPAVEPNPSIWSYRSDSSDKARLDKYAWIGEGGWTGEDFEGLQQQLRDASVRFRVNVGKRRQLIITFLRTYNNIGSVYVNALPVGRKDVTAVARCIDGLWNATYSSPESETMHLDPGLWDVDITLIPLTKICAEKRKKLPRLVHWMSGRERWCERRNWCQHIDRRSQKFKLVSIVSC